jgi:hypothetical protein
MPRLVLPVPEIHSAFTRPVILQVLRQLSWLTELSERTRIVFNGYEGVALTFDLNGNDGDSAQFDQSQRLYVTITERPVDEFILSENPHRRDALPIFNDPSLNVIIKPGYQSFEYRLTIEFRAEDKTAAEHWYSTMTARTAMDRAEITHSAEYEYAIPVAYYPILLEIHRLREAQGGYGQTFEQWWQQSASKKFTVLTDSAGKPRDIVFKEKQLNFLGWFDFTVAPEPTKGDTGSLWTISFDYVVRMDKPAVMVFHYPFVIHNQILSERFAGNNLDLRYPAMRGDKSLSNQRNDYFRSLEVHYNTTRRPIRIPYYDDWIAPQRLLFVSVIYDILTGPAPSDLRTLINFNQLEDSELGGRYVLKPHFLDYIQTCGQGIFQQGMSTFCVYAYENEGQIQPQDLELLPDFTVRTRFDMDLRKRYHVRIGVLVDLSLLQKSAVDALLNNPAVCLDTLKGLDPTLEKKGLLPKVVGGRLVNRADFTKAVAEILDTNKAYVAADGISRALVGAFGVVAWRRD